MNFHGAMTTMGPVMGHLPKSLSHIFLGYLLNFDETYLERSGGGLVGSHEFSWDYDSYVAS